MTTTVESSTSVTLKQSESKPPKFPEKNADRISVLAYLALMPVLPEKALLGITGNVVYLQVPEPLKIMNIPLSNPFSGKELTTQTVHRTYYGNSREEASDFEFAIERGLFWDIANEDIQRLLPHVEAGLSRYAPQYKGNAKAPFEQAGLLVGIALKNIKEQSKKRETAKTNPNSDEKKEEKPTVEEKIRASWDPEEIKNIVEDVLLALKYKGNDAKCIPLVEGIKAKLTSKQQFIAPLLAEEQKTFKR